MRIEGFFSLSHSLSSLSSGFFLKVLQLLLLPLLLFIPQFFIRFSTGSNLVPSRSMRLEWPIKWKCISVSLPFSFSHFLLYIFPTHIPFFNGHPLSQFSTLFLSNLHTHTLSNFYSPTLSSSPIYNPNYSHIHDPYLWILFRRIFPPA